MHPHGSVGLLPVDLSHASVHLRHGLLHAGRLCEHFRCWWVSPRCLLTSDLNNRIASQGCRSLICVFLCSQRHGDGLWVGSTPASLRLLALQLEPSLSGLRAPERPLFTHPAFWFKPRWRDGSARDRSLIGRSVLTTSTFRQFCRPVGAQSTTQLSCRPFCSSTPLLCKGSARFWSYGKRELALMEFGVDH